MSTHIVICSVKKLSREKKPHLNRLTLSDAKAAHVLKKFIQAKFIKVVVCFRRREIVFVTKTGRKKVICSRTLTCVHNKGNIRFSISFKSSFHEEYENNDFPYTTPLISASNPSSTASSTTSNSLQTKTTISEEPLDQSSSNPIGTFHYLGGTR